MEPKFHEFNTPVGSVFLDINKVRAVTIDLRGELAVFQENMEKPIHLVMDPDQIESLRQILLSSSTVKDQFYYGKEACRVSRVIEGDGEVLAKE